MNEENIFTVGGTVQASNGLYIPRRADNELLALCRGRNFAYVLTPRQLGKSSLMVRTAQQLTAEGVHSVIIDLSQIGVHVTPEEWYLGLLSMIEEQLGLETDAVDWWRARAHLGVTQRLTVFFEEVMLKEASAPVVVFVDEIDTTLSLTFTDDFFAAIRYFYNARAISKEVRRLSFVLIGVATPGDLIRDPQRTPFNIGQRVDLTDFTLEESLPLAAGLNLQDQEARQVLGWVMKWTGGHPYLTQRLCRALTDDPRKEWSETDVDAMVGKTFFGKMSEEDNNLQFVRDMLTKRAPDLAEVLYTYRDVLNQKRPVQDEEQSLVKSHLKLSGVAQRRHGALIVRNPIYAEVFNKAWVQKHLPVNWSKRLTRVAGGLVLTLMILSVPTSIWAFVSRRQAVRERQIAVQAQKEAVLQRDEANRLRILAEQQTGIATRNADVASEQRARADAARKESERQRQLAEDSADSEKVARQGEAAQRQKAEAAANEAQRLAISERDAKERAIKLGEQAELARQQAETATREAVLAAEAAHRAEKEAQSLREQAEEQSKTRGMERDIAQGQNQIAVASQLADQGRQLLAGGNGPAAASFLVRALTLDDRAEVRAALLEAEAKSIPLAWEQPAQKVYATYLGYGSNFRWSGSSNGRLITNFALSPNRQQMAVTIGDGTIAIINAETNQRIRSLTSRVGPWILIYSADGRQLMSRNQDGVTVDTWDVETGASLGTGKSEETLLTIAFDPAAKRLIQMREAGAMRVFPPPQGAAASPEVTRIVSFDTQKQTESAHIDLVDPKNCFSDDWMSLASGRRDGTIAIVNVQTGETSFTLPGHSSVVDDLAFSSDRQTLVSKSGNEIKIWDLVTRREKRSLHLDRRLPGDLVLSSDGRRLAAMGFEGFRVWDVESGNEVLSVSTNLSNLLFSPDGAYVAGQETASRIVKVWDVDSGELCGSFFSQGAIMAFANHDSRLLSLEDGSIKAWDIGTSRAGKSLSGHDQVIRSIKFSPDGKYLATSGDDKLIKIWDRETGREVRRFIEENNAAVVAFDWEEQRLVTFDAGSKTKNERLIKIWDTKTAAEPERISIGSVPFLISPNGHFIAIGDSKATETKLRNIKSGAEFLVNNTLEIGPASWDFSYDERRFAQASGQTIRLWETGTGKMSAVLNTAEPVERLCFSVDNQRLASVGRNSVQIWDLAKGKEISRLSRITGVIFGATFSPDGKLFAASVRQIGIKLWNADTGNLERTLSSSGNVTDFGFSPDGNWIVSNGSEVHLWNLEEKDAKGFVLPSFGPGFATLSPDGRWLASEGRNHRLRIWDFAVIKQAAGLDHWSLVKQFESGNLFKLKSLDLEIIPQLQVRDILGDKYNPTYELAAAGGVSVEQKDKAAEARENAYRSKPTVPATITGTIRYNGAPPTSRRIDTSADPVCDRENPNLSTEEWLVTDGKVANTVVYVKSGTRLENYIFDTPASEVVISRRGCQTIPRVVGVQTHQVLTIVNEDKTTHNFHFTPRLNPDWNQSMPQGGSPLYHEFAVPEIVPLKCNQHPWEKSYVGVFSHPFFAISGNDGSYTIAGLPPGRYTIVAWHESGGTGVEESLEVTIGAGESKTIDFSFSKP